MRIPRDGAVPPPAALRLLLGLTAQGCSMEERNFGFLSCPLVSLEAVPAKGALVTLGFVPVSGKQECEPEAAGFSVEMSLPSAFVTLLVV